MATIYAFQVRVSDDAVVFAWKGSSTTGIPSPPDATTRFEQVGPVAFQLVSSQGIFYPNGDPRWTYPPGGPLSANADTRMRIEFVPNILLTEEQGGNSTTNITVNLLTPAGAPTTFSGSIPLEASDGRIVVLAFTNGSATLTVRTSSLNIFNISQRGNNSFRFEAPLVVRVRADGIL